MTPARSTRILLLGRNGQLGLSLGRTLPMLGQVFAVGRQDCDLSQPDPTRNLLRNIAPTLIVNAAGYTDLLATEQAPELASRLNTHLPAQLAAYARTHGATLVQYSTDQVFDGTQAQPYRERDLPRPRNEYGRTKLAGETAVRAVREHLVFRCGPIISPQRPGRLLRLLAEARQQDVLSQDDAPLSPLISAERVADLTLVSLIALRAGRLLPGLYHLAASGQPTRYEFARTVLADAERLGLRLRCPAHALQRHALPAGQPVPTPCLLDTQLLANRLDLVLPSWQQEVRQVLTQGLSLPWAPAPSNDVPVAKPVPAFAGALY